MYMYILFDYIRGKNFLFSVQFCRSLRTAEKMHDETPLFSITVIHISLIEAAGSGLGPGPWVGRGDPCIDRQEPLR